MSWFLILRYGIAGAAWASTLSNVILVTLLLLIVRKKYGVKLQSSLLMYRSDIQSIFNQMKRKSNV